MLALAEVHYFAFPETRAGEIRTLFGEWLNSALQGLILLIGLSLIWSATARLRSREPYHPTAALLVFLAGAISACPWNPMVGPFDPLASAGLTLAYSIYGIGSAPWSGWGIVSPPMPQQVGWFAVIMVVPGVELMFAVLALWRVWDWTRARSQERGRSRARDAGASGGSRSMPG